MYEIFRPGIITWLAESLLFLCDQKYLSSLVNLYFSIPVLESLSLLGMVMEVVVMLPTPRIKNKMDRTGTCQVTSCV